MNATTCIARPLWITTSSAWRFSIAVPSALTTSFVVCDESTDQPTRLRENASSTTAQHTFPSRSRCSVIFVSHNRLARFEQVAVDEIGGCRGGRDLPVAWASPRRQSSQLLLFLATFLAAFFAVFFAPLAFRAV